MKIRGDRWECPYCYDRGHIKLPEVRLSLTWKLSCKVDLSEIWKDLNAALAELDPDGVLKPLLGKVLLHQISVALGQRSGPGSEKKMRQLEAFLNSTPELHLEESTDTLLGKMCSEVLYIQEGELTEQSLGSFWAQLLAAFPPEQYYDGIPEPLSDLQRGLALICGYYASADDDDIGDSLEQRYRLEDAFQLHWQKKALLYPNVERAKELLSHGEFLQSEDICRNILVTEYPEEVAAYSLEDLEDRRWDWLLEDVFERDVAKAIQMWRVLLEVAGPCLSSDPVAAEELLRDWKVLESPSASTGEAFFSALAEENFAELVFASAHVGHLHRQLLELCCKFGRLDLGQRWLELALDNPYTSESWEGRLRQVLSPAAKATKPQKPKPPAAPPPEDNTLFHYCTVQLPSLPRPYAYLTGGLPLQVGDWVEVPFGKDDIPRRGQVNFLTDCTRGTAPWPPEKTKAVLAVVDGPVGSQEEQEPPRRASTPLSPPVGAEPGTPPGPPSSPPPRGKPSHRRGKAALVLLILLAGLAALGAKVDAWYRKGEEQLIAGDYAGAVESLSHVPGFYREKRDLARYGELCLQVEGGGEEDYRAALQEIEPLLGRWKAPLGMQVWVQYGQMKRQYMDLLYENGLTLLAKGEYEDAWKRLEQVPEYPDVEVLLCYIQVLLGERGAVTSTRLRSLMESLEEIPLDYDGLYGEEIAALRIHLQTRLTETQAEERAEALKATESSYGGIWQGEQRPPSTSTSQLGGGSTPSTGYSLKDIYDAPEDLYEENPDLYDDLDEAWDEWEEG